MGAYKIASNLAKGAAGTFHFSFNYASKLSTQPPSPVAWNSYPLPGYQGKAVDYATCVAPTPGGLGGTYGDCSNNQTTINPADVPSSGSGLPYEIVATQPGITPGA